MSDIYGEFITDEQLLRGEIDRLRAELAAQKEATDAFWEQRDEWQERAQKAEAELAAVKARIAELEGAIEINKVGVKNLRARAECAEAEALKAKAHIAALCDAMIYSDSYGVQGSDFQCCHACSAGGAPNVVFKHDENCSVGKAEASAAEWWDDYKAAEADCKRAEAALKHESDCVEAAKSHITELENTIDLADKHTIMIMTALERAKAELKAMREVLEPFAGLRATRFMTDGLRYEFRVDAAWIRKARSALTPSPAGRE